MSFGGSTSQESIPKFKSFVSEAELEEKRKKRQEEWDKVRTAEDPVEAPEEEYDPRSLFERLEEQRLKKQADYEEAHKLKSAVMSLPDFVSFLGKLGGARAEDDRWLFLDDAHKAVANLSEEAMEAKRLEMKKAAAAQGVSTGRRSQLALLSAAVKRKSADSSSDLSKKQHTNGSGQAPCNGGKALGGPCGGDALAQQTVVHAPTALSCLGVLPGLGVYTDSSDSENSSFSDDADLDLDLIGRRRVQHEVDHSPKPN
ncbi:hypothetical protein HPB47_016755 [Ixodes persulcatus]|uniref:Uncharacterized protein n=1 Tax=Ixodes persulcatus TaxID=34615 RepID=A0AC60QR22_IXOPE|nr:hypothetical protein HPB47_016755 [Ixodes persulcatus]